MRTGTTILLLSILAAPALASESGPDGRLLRTEVAPFPPFAEVDKSLDPMTEAEYGTVVSDRRFVLERAVYSSGGLEVVAWLYRPESPAGKLPVIVFNRGSYLRRRLGFSIAPALHRFALAGFGVIAPAYRQSEGAAGTDQVGGDDVADLMHVVPLARQLPWADPERLFLFGESRGGMMVFQALRDGFPARAAATVGAFTDFDRLIEAQPERYAGLVQALFPNFATERAAISERRSAARWADRMQGPLLLLHGQNDRSVDPGQTLALGEKLVGRKDPWELRIVANGRHTLDNLATERDREVVEWFAKFDAPPNPLPRPAQPR